MTSTLSKDLFQPAIGNCRSTVNRLPPALSIHPQLSELEDGSCYLNFASPSGGAREIDHRRLFRIPGSEVEK
jgi:hypothetical protein